MTASSRQFCTSTVQNRRFDVGAGEPPCSARRRSLGVGTAAACRPRRAAASCRRARTSGWPRAPTRSRPQEAGRRLRARRDPGPWEVHQRSIPAQNPSPGADRSRTFAGGTGSLRWVVGLIISAGRRRRRSPRHSAARTRRSPGPQLEVGVGRGDVPGALDRAPTSRTREESDEVPENSQGLNFLDTSCLQAGSAARWSASSPADLIVSRTLGHLGSIMGPWCPALKERPRRRSAVRVRGQTPTVPRRSLP